MNAYMNLKRMNEKNDDEQYLNFFKHGSHRKIVNSNVIDM